MINRVYLTHMIPPALREVGQLVFEAVLQELKHHTDDHTHPPVPDHQRLTHTDTKHMTNSFEFYFLMPSVDFSRVVARSQIRF